MRVIVAEEVVCFVTPQVGPSRGLYVALDVRVASNVLNARVVHRRIMNVEVLVCAGKSCRVWADCDLSPGSNRDTGLAHSDDHM